MNPYCCIALLLSVYVVVARDVDGLSTVSQLISIKKNNSIKKNKKAIGLAMKTTTLHAHYAFFVNFFAAPAQLQCEMTKFESGNGKAINFTLSV